MGLVFAALAASVVMLGALRVTGQFVALGLSAGAFLALFVPMFDGGRSQGAVESLRRLARFPLFWLGLALLGLMLAQGLNADKLVVARSFSYRIFSQTPPVTWLPSGVDAPYEMDFAPGGMNAFRQMVMFGGPWLLLCALWAGLQRRRAFVALGWGVLLFGFLFAAYGVLLRIEGTQQFFDYYTMQEASFFSTFPYQNNAAAWLSLAFAVAVALGLWHWGRAADIRKPGGPHLMCAAFAVSFALACVCTLSFGGMLTTGVLLFAAAPAAILWLLWRKGVRRNTVLGGAVASGLLAVLALGFYVNMDLHSAEEKLRRKFNMVETNRVDNREPFRRATWDMIEYRNCERLWTGWGAGSYQWVSQPFLQQLPEFRPTARHPGVRSHHAHCDWLEMLMEWGILGVGIVAAAFLWMAGFLLWRWRRWTPATLVLVAALLLYMGHSWMDILNYSMPLLGLVAFVAVLAAKFSLSPAQTVAGAYLDEADSGNGGGVERNYVSAGERSRERGRGSRHRSAHSKDSNGEDESPPPSHHHQSHRHHHHHHSHHSQHAREVGAGSWNDAGDSENASNVPFAARESSRSREPEYEHEREHIYLPQKDSAVEIPAELLGGRVEPRKTRESGSSRKDAAATDASGKAETAPAEDSARPRESTSRLHHHSHRSADPAADSSEDSARHHHHSHRHHGEHRP